MEAASDATDDRVTAGSMALRRKQRPSARPSSMETQTATETEEGQQNKGWLRSLRSRRRPGNQKYAIILAAVLVVSTTVMGVILRSTEEDANARMSGVKPEFERVSAPHISEMTFCGKSTRDERVNACQELHHVHRKMETGRNEWERWTNGPSAAA